MRRVAAAVEIYNALQHVSLIDKRSQIFSPLEENGSQQVTGVSQQSPKEICGAAAGSEKDFTKQLPLGV